MFYPILSINISEPQFEEKSRTGIFSMQISSMYYNPIASFWEPFIEQTRFIVEMDSFSFKLRCKEIDINVSDTFINVLAMTWKSWNQKQVRHRSKRSFEKLETKNEEQDKQGVCPFIVKNKTGTTIYLSKMFGKEESVIIPSGGKYNICVNYEEIIEILLKEPSNDVKLIENVYKVSFDPSLNYIPIHELQFNEVESRVHHLTGKKLEYVIWSIALDNMIKLVTIRTALEFKNKTDYALKLIFFSEDSTSIVATPGESFCIPVELMSTPFSMHQGEDNISPTAQTAAELINYFTSQNTVTLFHIRRKNLK